VSDSVDLLKARKAARKAIASGLVRCIACGNEYETDEPCGKNAMKFRDKPEHRPLALYEDDIEELFSRVADALVVRRKIPPDVAQLIETHMRKIMKENSEGPRDDK
jgi:hypothetical protein